MLYLGDDWAEDHHDVELVDDHGARLARKRLPEGLEGVTRLHALIAERMPPEWVDLDPGEAAAQVRIGIETDRGPWVQALIAAGYQVYAINPMSVARYRERHSTSGAKSDAGDAHVLAEIVRLDHAHHRPVAGDSDQAEAMKLVARTHQTLIWDRTRQLLRLRSVLREFFPAALDVFDDLTASDALELLARAPDPARAARLSRSQIAAALRRAKRRQVDAKAADLQQRLRGAQLRQPDAVQAAYAAIVTAQVRLIAALNVEVEQLGQVVAKHFGRHRDAEHYLSQPGLGVVLSARILGEFGDDPHRFTDAKARKNYAGTSPITRASGTRTIVLARYARNRRLADAVHQWAFCSLKGSPGARAYYDALRARGTGHSIASNVYRPGGPTRCSRPDVAARTGKARRQRPASSSRPLALSPRHAVRSTGAADLGARSLRLARYPPLRRTSTHGHGAIRNRNRVTATEPRFGTRAYRASRRARR